MGKILVLLRTFFGCLILCLVFFQMNNVTQAQPGPSFSVSYGFFLYQKFDDPDEAALGDSGRAGLLAPHPSPDPIASTPRFDGPPR